MMKKVIKASVSYEMALRKASKILKLSQALLNEMDSAPAGLVENNDLFGLYDELINTIPELSRAIDNGDIEY